VLYIVGLKEKEPGYRHMVRKYYYQGKKERIGT
jgi:hypothetical protein